MDKIVEKPDLNDATLAPKPGEAKAEGHGAWQDEQVRAAIRQADQHPDNVYTHDQVFGPLKAKFRP